MQEEERGQPFCSRGQKGEHLNGSELFWQAFSVAPRLSLFGQKATPVLENKLPPTTYLPLLTALFT